jgi:hypothetical protein
MCSQEVEEMQEKVNHAEKQKIRMHADVAAEASTQESDVLNHEHTCIY